MRVRVGLDRLESAPIKPVSGPDLPSDIPVDSSYIDSDSSSVVRYGGHDV